jgi:peptide deformylase
VFINPELLAASGDADVEEGCLSVPGVYEKVRRAERVTVRALDAGGELFTLEAEGLLAVCIQHEMDHLEGKVFVEKLSRLKQSRILGRMKKQERRTVEPEARRLVL